MAKFIFNLDGVLRQRKQVERDRQRALAEKVAEVHRLSEELRQMDQSMQSAVADVRENRLRGQIDLAFIAAHRRYTMAMQRKATDQARKIVAAQQIADAARLELAEAAKQRKIIEKLREKRYQQWKMELERKAAMEMDEVGMQMLRAV
jgi:flagellar FliJ protein